MIVLPYLLLVLFWIVSTLPIQGVQVYQFAPDWLFPVVMGAHLLVGAWFLFARWNEVPRGRRLSNLILLAGLGIPPLAPVLIGHVLSGITRRAARGRAAEAGFALRRLSRRWFVASNAGVMLLVFWCYGMGMTVIDLPRESGWHLYWDPLTRLRAEVGTLGHLAFLALALAYARLWWRTARVLALERADRDAAGSA